MGRGRCHAKLFRRRHLHQNAECPARNARRWIKPFIGFRKIHARSHWRHFPRRKRIRRGPARPGARRCCCLHQRPTRRRCLVSAVSLRRNRKTKNRRQSNSNRSGEHRRELSRRSWIPQLRLSSRWSNNSAIDSRRPGNHSLNRCPPGFWDLCNWKPISRHEM